MKTNNLRNLVMISLLAATSFVLMYVVQVPLLPAAPFLKWDPSDLPNVLGGFMLGPTGAILIALLKSVLFLIFKGSEGPIGATMAFASSAALAATAALIYKRIPNKRGILLGLALGTVMLAVSMSLVNYYWALGAWGIPKDQHLLWVKSTIIPFNLLRGLVSSLLFYPVFVAVQRPLRRWFNQ